MKFSRVLLPTALVGALLLTGCSAGGGPNKDDAGDPCLASGAASDSIEVTGKVGEDLKLSSKTPVKATKLERTVLTEGEGKVAKTGQSVAVAMTMFNGKDGEVVQQQPETPIPLEKESLMEWAYEGLRCATPGQQAALTASFEEMYGAAVEPENLGLTDLKKSDPIVVVMEFGKITDGDAAASGEPGTLEPDKLLKKAEGKAQKAPEGFPSVKLDKDGAPTITMPEGVDAPEKLETATLIEGDGEEVKPGDRVYVNYRGVIWRTGEEFDSSWKSGEPVPFITTQVIPGFTKALEGQKVGSQVISIVPADDGGYGGDQLKSMGHEADDVMVFVLDILGTVHAE